MNTSLHKWIAKLLAVIASISVLVPSAFGQGTINPNPPPGPIVITWPTNQTVTVYEGSSIDLMGLFASYGPFVSYLLFGPPSFGVLSGDLPLVAYKPNTNFSGYDRMTYFVTDENGGVLKVGIVTIVVLPTNNAPHAEIELPNTVNFVGYQELVVISKRCNTGANLVLDGTASRDVDENVMTFNWLEDANNLSNESVFTNWFPVGLHDVMLSVNDGQFTDWALATFRVITPSEAIAAIQAVLEDSNIPQNRKRPLTVILSNAQRALIRGNTHAFVAELRSFDCLVARHIAPLNLDLATKLNDSTVLVLDAITGDREKTWTRSPDCPAIGLHQRQHD